MSNFYCSSTDGCEGGYSLYRLVSAFDDFPEFEFYDDVDASMLFVQDSDFMENDMEVDS